MDSEYLLQDPFRHYASDYIDHMHRRYGMRAVCYYTEPAEYRHMRREAPSRRDPRVAAQYLVDDEDWESFASFLTQTHHIEAAIPYFEQSVGPSARLAELLGLSWAQPGVLERFRDKRAMKEHLHSIPGGPRINSIAPVTGVEDVEAAIATGRFERFVLKPNDGGGNYQIGFFDAGDDLRLVRDYLASVPGTSLLMEEFIGGDEYFVNGLVDGAGDVVVWDVSRYDRREINGRGNVGVGDWTIRTDEPEFDLARDYAVAVVQATGLRRSPFHLELKIDDEGPCLIEVAARLPGVGLANHDRLIHGNLEIIAATAHYYLTAEPFGDLSLDWSHYDSRVWGHACGTSQSDGRIYSLDGIKNIEDSREFDRWVLKPRIGEPLTRTVGIGDYSWVAALAVDSADAAVAWGDWARDTLRVNDESEGRGRPDQRILGAVPGALRTADRLARHYFTPRLVRPKDLVSR